MYTLPHAEKKGHHSQDRRQGPADRRIGIPDTRQEKMERRYGQPDRRVATIDKQVTVLTGSGDYKGFINLNAGHTAIETISDYFIKSDRRFATLYNTVVMGKTGRVAQLNTTDIAMVISHDPAEAAPSGLRRDVTVSVRLRQGIGQLTGKADLMGETREMDRVSDLLNCPGKKWLALHEVYFRGNTVPLAVINMDFISLVEG